MFRIVHKILESESTKGLHGKRLHTPLPMLKVTNTKSWCSHILLLYRGADTSSKGERGFILRAWQNLVIIIFIAQTVGIQHVAVILPTANQPLGGGGCAQ